MPYDAVLLEALRKALAREYDIQEYIGRGSMALVFKAVERDATGRTVALKVLPQGTPPSLGERFRREARVAANLAHANVVPVYKNGQAAGTDYYTMQFVDGCTLDLIIAEHSPLPIPLVVSVLRSIAGGLAYTHDRRIIHRDVKGASVFVSLSGGVALADAGIAKALEEKGNTTVIIGSPFFMSPEQCHGERVGPQADQYSVGVLAFQMLAGHLPFEAATTEALKAQHTSAPAPNLASLRPEVPAALAEVVRRALSKAPADRFPTTRDMLRALEAVPLSEAEQDAAIAQLQQWAARATGATAVPAPAPTTKAAAAAAPPVKPVAAAPTPPKPKPAPPPPPKPAPPPVEEEFGPLVIEHRTPALEPEVEAVPAELDLGPLVIDHRTPALEPEPVRMAPPPAPPPPPPPPAPPPPPRPVAPPPSAPAWSPPEPVAVPERPRESVPEVVVAVVAAAPRRKLPLVPILGGVAVLGIAAAAVFVMKGRKSEAPPPVVPAAAPAPVAAAPAAPVPVAPTVGYVSILGDLPDDAILFLDGKKMSGLVFDATPGRHGLEIETGEFQPWETRITVKLGDTTKVNVELELIVPDSTTP